MDLRVKERDQKVISLIRSAFWIIPYFNLHLIPKAACELKAAMRSCLYRYTKECPNKSDITGYRTFNLQISLRLNPQFAYK